MSQPPDPATASTEPQYPAAPPAPPYPVVGPPGAPGRTLPGAPASQHPPATPQYPYGGPPHPSHGATGPAYPSTAPRYPPAPATAAQPLHLPATSVTSQPTRAPDDLDYRHLGSRVHVAAHQRGVDATAIGQLVIFLPGFLVSLAVVATVSGAFFGRTGTWLVVLVWLASGALTFHRPTELAFARHVLKLRPPLDHERARLEPVWREVTARAGIEAHSYELMVESSSEINAMAAAGHVVGVTTYALDQIPSSHLAAVLAHELGHHTGGHAWAGLLGYWYSLPGRIAWAMAKGLARIALAIASAFSVAATTILVIVMGVCVLATFVVAPYITVPLVLAPYLLAFAGRRGELRADHQAAELGFAVKMTEVLYQMQAHEDWEKATARAAGQRFEEPGALTRLLSWHLDNRTRIRALEPYLQINR